MTKKEIGISVLAIIGIILAGIWTDSEYWPLNLYADDSPTLPKKYVDSATVAPLPVQTLEQAATTDNHPINSSSKDAYRTLTDMAGRTVQVPQTISKVLCTSPPPATFVYMLAPEKLGGWLASPSQETTQYIPKEYRDKPVFKWRRKSINYEAYIAARPDIVFAGCRRGNDLSGGDLTQEKLGTIPVVCVDNTTDATGYGETIRFIGDVLGVPKRAEVLIAYYQNVLNEVQTKVATIPEEKRVHVYYAEGHNGLSTDPQGSLHSQLIEVCGGINVADCQLTSGSGMTPVPIESILMWKPDVIITTSQEFTIQAYNDATWKKIPAVRNHRVFLAPNQPFNWFDRPPGVNRIVGISWTAHILYPDLFPKEWFRIKAKEFYSIYYHYKLSDDDLLALLKE